MPNEQQKRLASEMYRWIVGVYRASRPDKVRRNTGKE